MRNSHRRLLNGEAKEGKDSIKDAFTCRFQAFWAAQTDNEKVFIGCSIAAVAFILVVFLYGIGDTPLNLLILNAADSIFLYATVLLAVFLYRLIRKRIIKSKIFYVVWALFFALAAPHIPVLFGYETAQIGDFYEAREYTEKYYVIMSRKPESETTRTVYKLPAEIQRRFSYEGSDDYGNEFLSLNYHINYLYFPNGGYLCFDYDYAYENSGVTIVVPNQETECIDYKDEIYYITLTTERAD